MKKTIEIECPDGYKPIYNTETGNVEIVSENIMERIKTYEDACEALGISPISTTEHDDDNDVVQTDTEHYVFPKHLVALYKLETISKALWGKWQPKPDAKGGEYYYYPWFALWTDEEIKREADDFKKKGALLAAYALLGSPAGFGCLAAADRSSLALAYIGFRLCRN